MHFVSLKNTQNTHFISFRSFLTKIVQSLQVSFCFSCVSRSLLWGCKVCCCWFLPNKCISPTSETSRAPTFAQAFSATGWELWTPALVSPEPCGEHCYTARILLAADCLYEAAIVFVKWNVQQLGRENWTHKQRILRFKHRTMKVHFSVLYVLYKVFVSCYTH